MKLTEHVYCYPEKGMPDCNTYLIKDEFTLLIDPGSAEFLSELLADMQQDGISPEDIKIITNTHLHPDHCWANAALKNTSGAKIISHPLHQQYYDVAINQGRNLFGMPNLGFETDNYLEDGIINIGRLSLEVIPSPGHSPDSICFYDPKEKFLIPGDVVFAQNTGRVDLPGGNAGQIKQSIEALSKLEIEYLLPGHMNIVSGAENVRQNFDFIRTHIFSWL